jgi:MFS family permease
MKKTTIILFGFVLMEMVVALDITGVTILVPTLQNYFQFADSAAGWILAAFLIPFAIFLIPLGYLADRIGPEKVLINSFLGFGFFSLLCVIAPDEYFLMAARFFKGICAAGLFATEFAIIIKYWEKPWRAIEIVVLGIALGLVVGPIGGSLFASPEYWRYFFIIGAGCSFIGYAAYRQLKHLTPAERPTEAITGFDKKTLVWGILLEFVVASAIQGFNVMITLHVQETLKQSPLTNALILVAVALGMVIMSGFGLGSKLFKKPETAAWFGSLMLAGLIITLYFLDWVAWPAYILFGLIGACLGLTFSTIEMMTLRKLPTNFLARGNAAVVSSMQLGEGVSSLLIPFIYAYFQTATVFFMAGLIILLFFSRCLFLLKK